MNTPWAHVVSVSGGKDSTATYLLALERRERTGQDFTAVFADVGNEAEETYDFVRELPVKTGGPDIAWVQADFTDRLAGKRAFIQKRWFKDLTAGQPGHWALQAGIALEEDEDGEDMLPPGVGTKPDWTPKDPFEPVTEKGWVWRPRVRPMSEDEAHAKIARALELLQPSGNVFLDLCLWKGRFPSTKVRFCTEELKIIPMWEHVQLPLLRAGRRLISWQGVRADESLARSFLPKWQRLEMPYGLKLPDDIDPVKARSYAYRPLLTWKREDVFAMHAKHNLKPNPLYADGFSRVGCLPCVMAKKGEILRIAQRYPKEIARIAEWEELVRDASKRGLASFMTAVGDPMMGKGVSNETIRLRGGHTIHDMVEWSKTTHGGRQYDLLAMIDFATPCDQWGTCEAPDGD